MDVVAFLTSPAARDAIASAPATFDPAADVPRLRKSFSAEQTAALADLLKSRQLARDKFGDIADRMLFTSEAIQQASHQIVARHRAGRFAGVSSVADLGCGIGGDAMSLGSPVVGVDVDRSRLEMARWNCNLVGVRLLAVHADLMNLPPVATDAAFADPARRDETGRRIFDVDRYRPPLRYLLDTWLPIVPNMAVKAHPGVRHDQLPEEAEAEFISLDGDMREACFWFGELRTEAVTRATVLPSGATLTGRPLAVTPPTEEVGKWIYEPDPSVLRAGLVGDLARATGLSALDPTIAYLSGDTCVESPFTTAYAVEDVLDFNLKRVRAYLRERQVGSAIVKKRGSAVDPEEFRRSLRLAGDEERVLFLTRAGGRPVVVVAERGQSGRT